jgi:carbon starvation protein
MRSTEVQTLGELVCRDDGRDFVPTNKWVLFGHHFAAIAGPGPLVGPTLAAQFGYLPGTLWLIAGAAFAGCVQDFIILFCSIRRDGKTLGEMARTEVSRRGGFIAQLAVLAIMIILLGVVALVVVNALKSSPWATFTLAMTIPIALLLGVYLRFFRPGRVMEASVVGVLLVIFAVVAGRFPGARGQVHAGWGNPGVCHHRVRLCRFSAARVAVAGPARLSECVH